MLDTSVLHRRFPFRSVDQRSFLLAIRSNVYPGQSGGGAGFKTDVETMLITPFPTCPVGNKNKSVRATGSAAPLSASGGQGWAYSKATDEFIINFAGYDSY